MRNLPVVPFTDRHGQLTRVLTRDDALRSGLYENPVLVMAGGFGVRLRPITANTPKPLVPLAEGTLLDRIIDHLRAGKENLDILLWAIDWNIHMNDVLGILDALVVNGKRLIRLFDPK